MVVLGRLKAPHGVRGWLKLVSYTEPDDNIFRYGPWYLEDPLGGWKQIDLLAQKRHGTGFVVQLSGIDDRDQASLLNGRKIAIEESCLPPPPANEYYWRDLMGLEVYGAQGEHRGRVKELLETGANDVMVVVRDPDSSTQPGVENPAAPTRHTARGMVQDMGKEQLIPFIESVVREVDLVKGTITVDWEPID